MDLEGWRNYPTLAWARRLSAEKWRGAVVGAAQQARTLEGFRQANLEAMEPDGDIYEWMDQWVDWHALWQWCRSGCAKQPKSSQRNLNRRVA